MRCNGEIHLGIELRLPEWLAEAEVSLLARSLALPITSMVFALWASLSSIMTKTLLLSAPPFSTTIRHHQASRQSFCKLRALGSHFSLRRSRFAKTCAQKTSNSLKRALNGLKVLGNTQRHQELVE